MKARRELIDSLAANVAWAWAWARGMAITAAVAVGLFILWPIALVLRAFWRWA